MDELLFLCHRLPYPPNKGDKIRSFHLLRHLAARYRVHLGTFVDDPADWDHVAEVRKLCDQLCVVPLKPMWATARSLTALAVNEALTAHYYRSGRLQRWVDSILVRGTVRKAVVFSSGMAGYLRGRLGGNLRGVLDFVDVDSDKWAQYGDRAAWPLNWLYRMEARRLLAHDARAALEYDANLFVSSSEAALFQCLAPDAASRVAVIENGVDVDYFSPGESYPSPYRTGAAPIVFTGAMDYRANADAVEWFTREVLPTIINRVPTAQFYIVGSRPVERVRRLERVEGVVVTGGVPDTRPYLAHARVAIAPLRIARGIQNKVLEALAMGVPVVATAAAAEGIDLSRDKAFQVADEPRMFAEQVMQFLSEENARGMGREARDWVVHRYNWEDRLAEVDTLLDGGVQGRRASQSTGTHPLNGYVNAKGQGT